MQLLFYFLFDWFLFYHALYFLLRLALLFCFSRLNIGFFITLVFFTMLFVRALRFLIAILKRNWIINVYYFFQGLSVQKFSNLRLCSYTNLLKASIDKVLLFNSHQFTLLDALLSLYLRIFILS